MFMNIMQRSLYILTLISPNAKSYKCENHLHKNSIKICFKPNHPPLVINHWKLLRFGIGASKFRKALVLLFKGNRSVEECNLKNNVTAARFFDITLPSQNRPLFSELSPERVYCQYHKPSIYPKTKRFMHKQRFVRRKKFIPPSFVMKSKNKPATLGDMEQLGIIVTTSPLLTFMNSLNSLVKCGKHHSWNTKLFDETLVV